MIDSSGVRHLRSNGTILDLLPIGQVLAVAGVFIVSLFVVVRPEASAGLGTPARILFWVLHVGTGLLGLWVASLLMARSAMLPTGQWPRILMTGVVGILVTAPIYLGLDRVWAPHLIDDDPDLMPASLLSAIAGEAVEVTPWFFSLWVLINLPLLLPMVDASVGMDDSAIRRRSSAADAPGNPLEEVSNESSVESSAEPTPLTPPSTPQVQPFLRSLPGVVGTDIVAVSSDLHYLNVWTLAGRTTVLGKLRDVANELAESGMLVHRSHWVAHGHVVRVVGTATDAACVLSNQLRIPISRRRWKAVREHFGRGVVQRVG